MVETRESVLRLLRAGKTGAEISRELGISKPAVSKHVAKLVDAGMWVKAGAEQPQAQPPPPDSQKQKSRRGGPPGNKNAVGNPGNPNARPPLGNRNAEKTGQYSELFLQRAPEWFREAFYGAADSHTDILAQQARRTAARLLYMYEILWQIEDSLRALADGGDEAAEKALVVIKSRHKQGLDQIGDQTDWTQTEAKSFYDRWLDQQEAITKVERLLSRTADLLKPQGNTLPSDEGADKLDQLVERMEAAARAARVQPEAG